MSVSGVDPLPKLGVFKCVGCSNTQNTNSGIFVDLFLADGLLLRVLLSVCMCFCIVFISKLYFLISHLCFIFVVGYCLN